MMRNDCFSFAPVQVYGRKGGPFDAAALMGHHFFVIRAIGTSPDSSSGSKNGGEQQQDALCAEYHATVADWDV